MALHNVLCVKFAGENSVRGYGCQPTISSDPTGSNRHSLSFELAPLTDQRLLD